MSDVLCNSTTDSSPILSMWLFNIFKNNSKIKPYSMTPPLILLYLPTTFYNILIYHVKISIY